MKHIFCFTKKKVRELSVGEDLVVFIFGLFKKRDKLKVKQKLINN